MTHFGVAKKIGPNRYRVVFPKPREQHHNGTPCGFCGNGRRADAKGLLCSKCSVYAAPKKWAAEQEKKNG